MKAYLLIEGKVRARFDRSWIPEPNTGCWLWVAAERSGYGQFYTRHNGERDCFLSHRLSWLLHNGPIPPGLHVLHKCDTPLCINPRHLFLGTQRDNLEDMTRKGRRGHVTLDQHSIVQIRNSNLSSRKLGKLFGVSHTQIGKIKQNRAWVEVI